MKTENVYWLTGLSGSGKTTIAGNVYDKLGGNGREIVLYDGDVIREELNKDFRIDLLVEDEIIIEIKAVEILLPVHDAQIISYLKLADKRLGFLINFNVPLVKNGFKRFVNNF